MKKSCLTCVNLSGDILDFHNPKVGCSEGCKDFQERLQSGTTVECKQWKEKE